MPSPISLPESPDGLTAGWLTSALQHSGFVAEDIEVTGVQQEAVGDGVGMMSELARLNLTWSQAAGDRAGLRELPRSLIAKFPSRNANNREIAMSYNLYEREVRYFAELEPRTSACSPATCFTAIDGDNFLILMEDMADYRVGDQVAGANLADTEAMTDELAKLHATFWNNVAGLSWVPGIANSYHATNMDTLVRIGWPNMVQIFGQFIDPEIAAREQQFIAALPQLQSLMDQGPITLLHGDFRMENVLFGTSASHHKVAIIDWQGPLLGRGMVDVALMLGQSTDVEVRRSHERDLINRYTRQLATLGITGYSAEQGWQDYQMALLYNWVYVGVVAGTLDVSNARAFAWMSQMVARQSAVSCDLDIFRLLP